MRKSNKPASWQIVALILGLSLLLAACQPASSTTPTAAASAAVTQDARTSAPVEATAEVTPGPTPTPYILDGAKTTDSGLQFLELTPGSGEPPQAGDLVTMNYIVTLTDGAEITNTYTANEPTTAVWGVGRLLPGWEEGVGMMKSGGKYKLVLPPDLAFGEQSNAYIPANSTLVMEIEVVRIEEPPVPATVKESDLVKSETGLQYYDLTVGDGAEAVKNATVSTQYSVWVKTDTGYTYVEQSQGSDTVDFVVGKLDTVFAGWDEGVTGMKVGGKRLLIIPAEIGVGDQGNNVIPAGSTLVMEIRLVNVTEPLVAAKVDEKDYTSTESGLKYYDLKVGEGASPAKGQTVVVHYTGWLEDGTQFDSSVTGGEPFSYPFGEGSVIAGWEEGVATMKVGGKRQLVVPAELGYGDTGAGNLIPPGATLIFEIELLDIQD